MIAKKEILVLIALVLLVFIIEFSPTGFIFMGVTIIEQNENIFYEENAKNVEFQITLTDKNAWYSYNGTGGIHGGRDIGLYSNNITEKFTIKNMGSTAIDVLIAAEDVANSNGSYIDVGIDGDFQIYIPNYGWKDIPDNDANDADGKKDSTELCIANDLLVGRTVAGFDFRLHSNAVSGNYTSQITLTTYNSDTINPCSRPGTYVTP